MKCGSNHEENFQKVNIIICQNDIESPDENLTDIPPAPPQWGKGEVIPEVQLPTFPGQLSHHLLLRLQLPLK